MDYAASYLSLRRMAQMGLGIPILLIMLLGMMILPLPTVLLDMLFTFNIALSLLVLLASIYTMRPLDFGSFPTVLLVATLLRLALNIASTRIVLLYGHTGDSAAGQVIRAFGEVVIGRNYIVGFVVFAIFIIINFIVITKGAGRVSEVSARFTLDAMPGKQMAIDADLNAGVLSQEEAKSRRLDVSREADFYGAMDGSSKFIRGDAIAGILILLINLIGGTLIGTLQHDMDLVSSLQAYALLTIGDGLVAQMPALILSTAAAIMVTRVSSAENIGSQVLNQVFGNRKTIMIVAGVMVGLGLMPGMPHVAFSGLGLLLFGGVFLAEQIQGLQQAQAAEVAETGLETTAAPEVERELDWEDVPSLAPISLEMGVNLIPLAGKQHKGELLIRIRGVRKKLSAELGFLIPPVRIRDSMALEPNHYKIEILGVVAGTFAVYPDKMLAIDSGHVLDKIQGVPIKDPAFQLDAVWIESTHQEHAQTVGYTVVDASTVIATHLNQLIQHRSYRLLGHDEVQKLLDLLAKSYPKLVEDLVPKRLSLGVIAKVLQNLLQEYVPIRDMRTIAENLTQMAAKTQDPDVLSESVRMALGRLMVQQICGFSSDVAAMTLSPDLEQLLQKLLQSQKHDRFILEPGLAERIQQEIEKIYQKYESAQENVVLLVSSHLRMLFARFVKGFLPTMAVLAYQEIPQDKKIKIVGIVGHT